MARRMISAGLLGVLALAAAACAVPMGDLGGPISNATGINDAGIVVGTSDLPPVGGARTVSHGFERLPDNSVIDLGTLPGHDNSSAARINAGGTVAGTSWGYHDHTTGPVPPALEPRVVTWDPDGHITDLGTLGPNTEVLAIDVHGIVIGESGGKAFVHDPAVGGLRALPDLPGGTSSRAHAMNDRGQVVGYQLVGNAITAVRWDLAAGTVEDLTDDVDDRFIPYAINDRGTMGGMVSTGAPGFTRPQAAVVLAGATEVFNVGAGDWSVVSALNESDTAAVVRLSGARAYHWQPANGLVELAEGQASFVWDVNEAGSLVGMSNDQAVFYAAPPVP